MHEHSKKHEHCGHCIHLCGHCDKVYCCKCVKEWGAYVYRQQYYYYPPVYTDPYWSGLTSTNTINSSTNPLQGVFAQQKEVNMAAHDHTHVGEE